MKEDLIVIGGPCAVESREQIENIYSQINSNIDIFRGGAYKPRTSVHSFQGLGPEGLTILSETSNHPVASEVMDSADVEHFANIEYLQIGARNMQNFSLLKAVGKSGKKVILKRGLAATVAEWLAAAEYLEHYGAKEVLLCERGIRTFSDAGRFTLDLAAVLKVKAETNYRVIVDVSHPAGNTYMITDLARAAVASGADGVMIECHDNPPAALSDADQQLTPAEFNKLVTDLKLLHEFINKLKN